MCLPILYSFRRCPYAIRARMALAYAEITYELREVSLKNKPKEMLEISPKGTTPVMQIFDASQNFMVLEESLDIMRWALQQNDPLNWGNLSNDDLEIANQLITTNDREFKQALDRYKYANRFPEQSPEFYRQQAEEFLKILERKLCDHSQSVNSQFLIGDRQTLVDVAVFPFVRQFAYVDIEWFNASSYLNLQRWLRWHESSVLFELVMQKFPVWESE
ncbi:MAG: glutathione S-transferase [Pseudanabaenaceae cyanobacterium]